ncbi:proteasome subunit beta [Candidatus Methanomethylophilus sp. 1R26]|uniref:proteasome subunit beta n=1 Tax=Candidatus Methanomethylophilus sp. 1R26 TaxID=1769296 RepID=UPI00073785B6|nr:proteasome subunit beta [Candidatus Methanomethylophilus sp. 1R26]KUE73686.1 proteasome subunit beta [Candidatus Methanomethylophilus sp. 1R26]TQS78874.1 MAG: proteasome subunit beta [Methanomethylophilus alvi]WII09503.1 proteasome subunit beta [Methanomassiliicoccales archaeon LGM-DZ1]
MNANADSDNVVKTGTTTIGLKIKDGVVLATDQRATMGNLIANSHVQKVYPLSDNIGMTISGLVGDAQLMVRFMSSQISLYEMQKGAKISVQTAATLMGSVIRQGFYLGPILAGVDRTGGHVFSVDGAGGVIEDDYTSSGSGSITAYGALETLYKPDMTEAEAIDVAISGLNAARRRDNYTGDGMLILVFDSKGYHWIDQSKIKKRCEELGFRYPN